MTGKGDRTYVRLPDDAKEALIADRSLWDETDIWKFEKQGKLPDLSDLVIRSVLRDLRTNTKKEDQEKEYGDPDRF